jgi:hypothetical protein
MKYESTNTHQVLSAIDNARQSFLTLEKSGVNNYFKNNKGVPHLYSTLSDIFSATTEALYEHDLTVNYQTKLEETSNGVLNILTTTITHLPSGEFISSASNLGNHTKSQELGSAITYLRRYHIQAMLNLEADFEDDGNLSSGNNTSEGKGNDINKSVDMPSRKYTVYNKDGSVASQVSSFNTYYKTLVSNLSSKVWISEHSWTSQTIIQLQDIIEWASKLDVKYKKGADAMIKKAKTSIQKIKEESANEF